MLADFYIPRLSNDIKIVVQKNHLRGKILYRIPGPVKNGVFRLPYFSSIDLPKKSDFL